MSARSIRGRIAAEARYRPSDDRTELRREYAEAKLTEYIERTIAQFPPLTVEQRDRLATLLRGGAA